MAKHSKRRHQKHKGKTKKASRHGKRTSKSPVVKKKRKEKQKAEAQAVPQEAKKPRRLRRYEWKSQVEKKKREKKKKIYVKKDWYWGMISQTESEEYLKKGKNGDFLLRSWLYQDSTRLIVSVVSGTDNNTKVLQYQATIKRGRWQLENSGPGLKSILELIDHYRNNFIGMTNIKLINPVKAPDWFIKSYDVLVPKGARPLGGGNFGQVVLGAFRRRLVAVKMLIASGQRLLVEREAMMKEANNMAQLEHPYITKMVGLSIDQLPPMLLVELMTTTLLSHLQKYGKYTTIAEKLLYCWQLSSGLAYMASKNLVHRDIAARNALFSRYGILKLSDFGLSDETIKLAAVNTTRDVLPIGWLPPESVKVSGVVTFNEKTDVWMFGVTCTEIFKNGRSPIEDYADIGKNITKYKDGDVLHKFTKYTPQDVQEYLKKTFMFKPADRPTFTEISTVIDLWLKLKYTLPPLRHRTVQMIKNCSPLTNAEYEILYHNNWDWLPAVRKVKMRKKKEKKKSKTNSKRNKSKPREVLKHLKKKLIKRRKKNRLRIKLRWWRKKRREEKERMKTLRDYGNLIALRKGHQRANVFKHVLEKYEKLVDLYRKMMMVKYTKTAPNRITRFRLRRHRVINKMSKHPESRNGKVNRLINKTRNELKKQNRTKFDRPVIPPIPKFVSKKQNKKKKKMGETGKKKEDSGYSNKVAAMSENPSVEEKRNRKIRKRRRHNLRKRNKRKNRKKRRGRRRQRRRQKNRRRHRKMKMKQRRIALTVDQKERIRSLKKRRDEQLKLRNRLKRNERIGMILRDWRALRRAFIYKRSAKLLKRLAEKKKKKSKDKEHKSKTARKSKRKSKN
uniref:Tyrosine-protein kinase n=1 Tax=Caenorhabditis tropicalis TaxID=1561998 RepID=A0A1I7U8K7_9PELO